MKYYDLLDEHRRLLPKPMRLALADADHATDASARYRALLQVGEVLAERFAAMANTAYVSLGSPIPDIDKYLRTFPADRGASLGQNAGAIKKLIGAVPADPLAVELREQLEVALRSDLGRGARRYCRGYALAIEAAGYRIPSDCIESYVTHRIGAVGVNSSTPVETLACVNVSTWLNRIIEARNDISHSTGKERAPWWRNDGAWFSLLEGLLRPAVEELLGLESVAALLVGFEVVEFRRAVPRAAGGWEVDVVRDLDADSVPRDGLRLRTPRDPRNLSASFALVRREGRALVPTWLPWHTFPTPIERTEDLLARYRDQYAIHLFNDGLLDSDERTGLEAFVETKFQGGKVWQEMAKAEEKKVLDAWTAIGEWARKDSTDAPELRAAMAWLPEDKRSLEAAREHIKACTHRQQDLVCAVVHDAGPFGVSHKEARARIEDLPGEIFDLIWTLLRNEPASVEVNNERLVRAGAGRELIASVADACRAAGEPRDANEGHRLRHLAVMLRKLLEVSPLNDGDRDLGIRDVDLLILRCDSVQAEVSAESDLTSTGETTPAADGTVPSDASVGKSGPAAARGPLVLEVDGMRLEGRSFTKLLQTLGTLDEPTRRARLVGLATGPTLPYLVGTSRCLANREPKHANDTPFGYAVEIVWGGQKVYFEANFSPPHWAVEKLADWFRDGGLPVAEGLAVPSADALDVPSSAAPGSHTPASAQDLVIILEVSETEPDLRVEGGTVREFLEAVVQALLAIESARSRFVAALPIRAGWKRYVASGNSPHHPGDQKFTAAVEVSYDQPGAAGEPSTRGTIFLESHFSRRDALSQAFKLCEASGIHAYDPSEEDDDADGQAPVANDQPVLESTPDQAPVELTCQIDEGDAVQGGSVRELLTKTLDAVALRGWMPELTQHMPYALVPRSGGASNRSSSRYLCNLTALHENGRPFRNAMAYEFAGTTLWFEINLDRPHARLVLQKLVDDVRGWAVAPRTLSEG